MILFHLTNLSHLVEIENDGFLEVTESNIGAPEILDDEPLPPMIPVYYTLPDGSYGDSHPDHPDFHPTVIPRQIYLALHDQGHAPERIDMDVFNKAIEPFTHEIDGHPSVNVAVVVGFDPDNGDPLMDASYPGRDQDATMYVASKYGDHVGPDVVWLTDDPTPTQDWQALGKNPSMPYMYRKNTVLFTVEVPDDEVRRWDEWAREQGILEHWYEALDGGTGDSKHWYVIPRRIPKDEWVSIHNTEIGSLYWDRDMGHAEGDERFAIPMPTSWVHVPLVEEI